MQILGRFSGIFIIVVFILTSCLSKKNKEKNDIDFTRIGVGIWRMEMPLNDSVILPFHVEFTSDSLFLLNADERLGSQYWVRGDSLFCKIAVFDSWLGLRISSKTTLDGRWLNKQKGVDYFIPVYGQYSGKRTGRILLGVENADTFNFSGKYEVFFGDGSYNCRSEKAIGEFFQEGNKISGTFLTKTGDYRYLEGGVSGNKIFLSTFDGSHAFMFDAEMINDTLRGNFYSGNHYHIKWNAFKNDLFQLENPYKLTFLKPEYRNIYFALPRVGGADSLVFPSKEYENKVVIIQLLGSWCPNCLDETRFYTELHETYHKSGLRILGVGFELPDSLEKKKERINDLISFTGAKYDFVVGGGASKASAGAAFPQLNHVMSFPTSMFIDKKGNVRKIHTGFTGPGTGKHYTDYTKETIRFIELLLKE
ncbi:MAG: peroxiredoxin family protein [Flavobacteriales bacterium]